MKIYRFYRYENHTFWIDDFNTKQKLELDVYEVLRATPKGYWVVHQECPEFMKEKNKKLVIMRHKKRFAYESKEQALHAFKCRKSRQISILQVQLENTKEALKVAEEIKCS